MKNLKNLSLTSFLFIFSLFFIPQICRANMASGLLINSPYGFGVVSFIGIWLLEALIIRKKLEGKTEIAVLSSLSVNLITSLMGILIINFYKILQTAIAVDELMIIFLIFFSASFVIEGFILHLFYRKESLGKIFKVSFIMNLYSYGFLIIFFLFDALVILFFVPLLLIINWTLKLFKMFSSERNITGTKELILIILIVMMLISIFLISIESIPPNHGNRGLARDAKRASDIRQISLAMEMYLDDEGNNEKYLQSEIMPDSIGSYLNPTPKDPVSDGKYNYHWISNINNPEKFCIWVERERGDPIKFLIANEKGTGESDRAPINLEDCSGIKLIK